MIRSAALASTALVALTTPALADPFSLTALLTTAFTAAGLTGTVAGVSVATLAATFVGGVITIGAGMLITSLLTSTPKPENGTIAVQQPLPYRIYGYGQARIPGAIMFKETSGGALGVVQALNGHLINAFVGLYLNDDQGSVPISNGSMVGNVSRMVNTNQSNDDPRYKDDVITIDTRLGTDNPSNYSLTTTFPDTWPASSVGKGIASLSMLCAAVKAADFSSIYPYGEPKPSAIVQQALVYDPRVAGQDPANPSTWAYSDNPVLCLLHFRCFSDYGSKLPYATAILPNVAAWIQAANDCDDLMPLKAGGSEKRYRVGGYTTTQQDRRSTAAAILAACDGWMCDRGDGSIDVKVGKYDAPTITLTDDDIVGFSIQRGTATKDKINRVTARYTSPANGYISVETNPMDDLADQALRFGPPRAVQLDLTWCQYTGQASRLQKREFIRQSRTTRGTLTLKLSGLNACFERWVLVNSNTIPRLMGVVIEPSKPLTDIANGRVTINFISSGPDIDIYDPNTDESPAPYVPQRPVSVGIPVPENVAVVPEETSSAGSTTVFLVVSWDTPLYNGNNYTGLSYIVQYRTAAVGSTPAGGWVQGTPATTVSGTRTYATTGAVPVGAELDVQVISGGGTGQLSDGSTIVQANTDLVAPGTPTILTCTGGTGQIALTCTGPISANLASIQFFRTLSGGAFASASAVGQPVPTTSGGTATYTDMVVAGTYDYFATAIATNGASSAPDGPTSGTAT